MTMESAVAKALENFNPDNQFHVALKNTANTPTAESLKWPQNLSVMRLQRATRLSKSPKLYDLKP